MDVVQGDAGGFGGVCGADEEIVLSLLVGSMPLDRAGARGFVSSRRSQRQVVKGFLLALPGSCLRLWPRSRSDSPTRPHGGSPAMSIRARVLEVHGSSLCLEYAVEGV